VDRHPHVRVKILGDRQFQLAGIALEPDGKLLQDGARGFD
jgi:hypothetical protein